MVSTKHARKLPDARISRQININQTGSNRIKSDQIIPAPYHPLCPSRPGRTAACGEEHGGPLALPFDLAVKTPFLKSLESCSCSRPYRELSAGNAGAPIGGRREHGRAAGNWWATAIGKREHGARSTGRIEEFVIFFNLNQC